MKENKPLLYINSAQSDKFGDQSQYIYDSRYHKPIIIIKKEVEEINNNDEEEVLIKPQIIKENIINPKEINGEEILTGINKKLMNKIDLLNKRALLGRYVQVSVETKEKIIEGYFLNKLANEIVLRDKELEVTVPFEEIKEILIIKL